MRNVLVALSIALTLSCSGSKADPDSSMADTSIRDDVTVPDAHNRDSMEPSPALCTLDAPYNAASVREEELEPAFRSFTRAGTTWTMRAFDNPAYECGADGHHSFVVGHDDQDDLTEERPLLLFLHGGGYGSFDESGNYRPASLAHFLCGEHRHPSEYCNGRIQCTEERRRPHPDCPPETPECACPEEAVRALVGGFRSAAGLLRMVQESGAGFRYLAVSLCDHDVYSGVGCSDPGNPFGDDPRTEGLLATRAALAYATELMPTSHVIAYGTSAGGVGVANLAHYMARHGEQLAGVVADSGDVTPNLSALAEQGCIRFADAETTERFVTRTGPYVRDAFPEDAMVDGSMETPFFLVYSTDDRACHCNGREQCGIDLDGEEVCGSSCSVAYRSAEQAIERHNRGHSYRICVDDPTDPGGPSNCDLHSPTLYEADAVGGDTAHVAGDYNSVIMCWILQQIGYLVECAPLEP